jgi:hypothetical protein
MSQSHVPRLTQTAGYVQWSSNSADTPPRHTGGAMAIHNMTLSPSPEPMLSAATFFFLRRLSCVTSSPDVPRLTAATLLWA